MRNFSIALTKIAKFSEKNQHQIDNYPFFQKKLNGKEAILEFFRKNLMPLF